MKRIYSILLVLVCGILPLMAQVTFKIQAPRQTEVGQRIRVSYIANTSDIEDFGIGDFKGFNILYGPSKSYSNSFSMINGKTTQNSSTTFTYTIVAAEEGTYTLPAATIVVDGKSYKSGSANIEVLPASNPDANSGSQGGGRSMNQGQPRQQARSNVPQEVSNKELFMTVTANKKKIYEQEAIVLTYKLYTLVNIQQISGDMPQLDGFHVREIESKRQMTLKYERLNGRNYGTAVWKQYVLFPQKTGKITVPSLTFDSQIEVQNPSMDPFDIFFGGGSLTQYVRKSIVAPALEIEVLPLPAPKPANFTGAVGKFTLSGSLTPEQINANDAATLRLVVSGQGNMKLMNAPKVTFPQDFEIYDPKPNDKTTSTAGGEKGNMIYDYVVVPRHGGKFTIAPVEFCYFDPDAAEYKTIRTDSFSIAVAKAKGGSEKIYHEQEDLKVINDDIRFIKLGKYKAADADDTFFGSTSYWLVYLLLFGISLGVIAIYLKQNRDNANVMRSKGKKANKVASKKLKRAAALLKSQDVNQFYEEIMHALLGYAGDKLGIQNTDLNKDNVAEALRGRGVAEDLIDEYLNVLAESEFARFAPGDSKALMDKTFKRASDIINNLNAVIKKA